MSRPPLPPDDAIEALLPDDVRKDVTRLRHPEAIDVWYGVVWGRLGRCDHAWAWWNEVNAAELLPWIAGERGRVVRELGLHERAERFEGRGLELAEDVVDAVMLRLGLAADAIGRGHLDSARLRYRAAAELLGTLPETPRVARQRLRANWVLLELDLRMPNPERYPRDLPPQLPSWQGDAPTWPDDYEHGTAFHRAKGLLFAGIVQDDQRLLDAAVDLAPPMLLWAVHLARADREQPDALRLAREAWKKVVAPPGLEKDAARTPAARRLAGS